MTDRPIQFSAPMVKALIAGRKTQTRRVITNARVFATPESRAFTLSGADMVRALQNASRFRRLGEDSWFWESDAFEWQTPNIRTGWMAHFGYAPGDRLWARENWRTFVSLDSTKPIDVWSPEQGRGAGIAYEAGGGLSITKQEPHEWLYHAEREDVAPFGKLRPGMFMPRWASRLTLTVTDVRVERLQDISEKDATAEGIVYENIIVGCHGSTGVHIEITADRYFNGVADNDDDDGFEQGHESAGEAYLALWDHLNRKRGYPSDTNPWVVAVSFDCRLGNIDQLESA